MITDMLELSKSDVANHRDKAAIVPIQRLQNIRQDLEDLKGKEDLNNFQQYILNDLYKLDTPDSDFQIRSIIIVASPSPSSVKIRLNWREKSISTMLPASYVDKEAAPARIENYLQVFLKPRGYHVRHAPQLPHKLLAVRSGLGEYGRNNICYVEGMGSFLNLALFFSDVSCAEDTWQDIRQMELCHTCQACLQNCPTAAIMPSRFLIDNERCLTYFNEAGGEWDFPGWIDPASHHTLYGCLRCQTACPKNKQHLNSMLEPVEFSEQETAFLLEGKSLDQLPEDLRQKVKALNMTNYLGALPRNLRVLFNQAA